jgi:hypothetical protein
MHGGMPCQAGRFHFFCQWARGGDAIRLITRLHDAKTRGYRTRRVWFHSFGLCGDYQNLPQAFRRIYSSAG